MSVELYKILHLAGLFFLFASMGGLVLAHRSGTISPAARKLASITHGVALVVVLFGGFGLLKFASVQHNPATWPGWVWAKFAIWLFMGGALVLVRKKPQLATLLWVGLPLLGVAAGYIAIYKPF